MFDIIHLQFVSIGQESVIVELIIISTPIFCLHSRKDSPVFINLLRMIVFYCCNINQLIKIIDYIINICNFKCKEVVSIYFM
jgi:hypothetical protein